MPYNVPFTVTGIGSKIVLCSEPFLKLCSPYEYLKVVARLFGMCAPLIYILNTNETINYDTYA